MTNIHQIKTPVFSAVLARKFQRAGPIAETSTKPNATGLITYLTSSGYITNGQRGNIKINLPVYSRTSCFHGCCRVLRLPISRYLVP